MAQFISKAAVVAEIEKRRDAALMRQHNLEAIGQETVLNEMVANELNRILSLLDTIETKEVDLEKEIKDTCRGYRINESHEQELGKRDIENIAHYFYELGLKAQRPAFETDNSLGSPDYERGFKHGRDFQAEADAKNTDTQKVINYLIREKGYPINTQGDIPSYEETVKIAFNTLEKQKG